MIMLIHLLKLVSFIRIVDLGSFSKAADSLGLSAPAVSKQIRELERFLQVQLLRRSTRSFTLTQAGQSAYGYFSNMIQSLDQFCEHIPSLSNNPYLKKKVHPILDIKKDDY
jgi:DNA-binding transcriptional LysR family regulator